MVDKASEAFRTISEVSVELGVPPHVLRFWETKFPSVRPLKRSGGRRYYRPNDVLTIAKIRDLLYTDGFTIKGAQRFVKSKEFSMVSKERAEATGDHTASELLMAREYLETARTKLAHIKRQLDT